MDIETTSQVLGNFGEFVGAIAVVVTLIYLAIQVRHSKEATEANTRTIRANAAKEVYVGWSNFCLELSRHPDKVWLDKILKPDADYSQLNEEEKVAIGYYFRSVVERFASEHALFEGGVLPSDVYEELSRFCAGFVSAPALADLWKVEQEQPIYSRQFVAAINSISTTEPVTGATPHETT
jgi:hypothetical protein